MTKAHDYKHSSAFFPLIFVKRNILIAISIILVEMAVKCLRGFFFFVYETQSEDKGRAILIVNLMSPAKEKEQFHRQKLKTKPHCFLST